jgi:hypothetical protein
METLKKLKTITKDASVPPKNLKSVRKDAGVLVNEGRGSILLIRHGDADGEQTDRHPLGVALRCSGDAVAAPTQRGMVRCALTQ